MAGSSHLTQRWGKEQAAGDSGGPTEELCGGSGGPGRFTGPGACSIKRKWKLDIRRGQPCGADTQTKQTCSRVSMTPKYQLSSPGCPGPCSVACSPSAVCGLFTLWVLPVSWENIPGLAEQCSWKEKDVPALSVFL